MIVHGTVRSTAGWEHEGSGPNAGAARRAAVETLPEGYDLVDVQTVSARPGEPVTMKAFARSTATQVIQAAGDDEAAALAALRAAVPADMLLLEVVVGEIPAAEESGHRNG